jgi:hypothetical protein
MEKYYILKDKHFIFIVFLVALMCGGIKGLAQVAGDFRSRANTNWNTTTTWERYNGSAWEASGVGANNPGQIPTSVSNVFIQSNDAVTLNANAACKDLNISHGNTINGNNLGTIDLATFTLSVYGKLRNYYASVGNVPGTSGVDYNVYPFAASTGKVSIEGNSRALTTTGEWSRTINNTNSGSFPLEINLNAGQTVTLGTGTGIKVSALIINTGTLDAGTNDRIDIDNGNAGLGDVTINANGTLKSGLSITNNATDFVITKSDVNRAGNFVLNGTMILSGAAPLIQFNSIVVDSLSTVEYNRVGAQSFLAGSLAGAAAFINYGNLTVSNGNTKTLVSSIATYRNFTIGANTTFALSTFNDTLKSNNQTTAYVSAIPTTAIVDQASTGRFVIERYLPAYKAWRLLATPIEIATSPTISAAWREGNVALSSTGFGTQITGPTGPFGAAAILDVATQRGSMKSYDATTNKFVVITDANATKIANKEGYFVFVRGDRGVGIAAAAAATNLRMKGKILIGDQPFVVLANKFLCFGNPYPSRIDFRTIYNAGISPSYYVWNPNPVGTIYNAGKYEVYVDYGDGNYRLGNIAGPIRNYIESGQAVFIQSITGGIATVKESDKFAGSSLVSRVGVAEGRAGVTNPTMEINLYTNDTNGQNILADALIVNFDNGFSNGMDNMDVRKISNAIDNLSIKSNATDLVLERRASLNVADTINLNLANTRVATYHFHIDPSVLSNTGLEAFLVDKFLQTETAISLTDSTNIIFDITNNTASKASNRFMIIFKQVFSTNFTTIAASRNADATVTVNWGVQNETNVNSYAVEHSNDGVNFTAIAAQAPAANNGENSQYTKVDVAATDANNWYRIKAVALAGATKYTAIAMVNALQKTEPTDIAQQAAIAPNLITDGMLHLLLKNQPAGKYNMQIINTAGQVMYKDILTVQANNGMYNINFANKESGHYQLSLINETGTKTTLPFMVK